MRRLAIVFPALLLLASCSTTKLVPEGEYKLHRNKITIVNDSSYKASELLPYVKQKPSSWTPMLYVYNWSSGKGTGWDRIMEKIGVAPVIFDSTYVASSRNSILSHLEYTGYYNSSVSSTVVLKDKKAWVEYLVKIGKGYMIDSINFIVKDSLMMSMIKADSTENLVRAGDMLSEEALEAESERLAVMLRNNGYFGFSKNYFFFAADTLNTPGHCTLLVKMENYTRNESPGDERPHLQYRIGKVEIVPQRGLRLKQSFLDNLNRIESGSLYNESIIKKTYERMTSVPVVSSANIEVKEVDSAKVDCLIKLSPSKLQSIKFNLDASYNSNSLFGIAPAVSYAHKNIFGRGEVFSLGLSGNFQFKPRNDTRSTEFTISTGLSFPKFLIIPNRHFYTRIPHTDITLSFNYQNRPEYEREILSLTYGYRWNFGKNIMIQFSPVRANIVKIFNMTEEFKKSLTDPYMINSYSDHFDVGGNLTFYYTTDPSSQPKHSYFYVRSQNNFAGNILSLFNKCMDVSQSGQHTIFGIPYSQYVRTELSLVETFRFGNNDQFALAGRLLGGIGFAYGNSLTLPFEQLFYSGGSSSLRGWQARSVGPGSAPIDTTFKINNQSGDMRLEANVEFLFPIFWKFEGGLFVDAGNVWLRRKDDSTSEPSEQGKYFSFKDMFRTSALDWGLGLRLDFGMILVRLDMGLKTYDPVTAMWRGPDQWFRSDGYSLHFGIGYPF